MSHAALTKRLMMVVIALIAGLVSISLCAHACP